MLLIIKVLEFFQNLFQEMNLKGLEVLGDSLVEKLMEILDSLQDLYIMLQKLIFQT